MEKFYYVDNDPTKEKVVYQNNTAAERYDGKQKHYVSAIEDATITGVNMTVEYYEGKATGSDISSLKLLGTEADNRAPKDVGGYTVRYTFSEHQNYEPAKRDSNFRYCSRYAYGSTYYFGRRWVCSDSLLYGRNYL